MKRSYYLSRYKKTSHKKRFGTSKIVSIALVLVLAAIIAISVVLYVVTFPIVKNKCAQTLNNLMYNNNMVLDSVSIDGQFYSSNAALAQVLNLAPGTLLNDIDLEDARNRLLTLPWIKEAEVCRSFPNKINVHIKEKEPIAIWQFQQKQYLIDKDGNSFTIENMDMFKNLIIVTGENAPKKVPEIINILKQDKEIYDKIVAIKYIGERRWDLILRGNLIIKLPTSNIKEALGKLNQLLLHKKISDDAKVIDLRIADRVYFTN